MPTLRNGAEVPFPTILTTLLSLDALYEGTDEGIMAVFELHRHLEDNRHAISERSKTRLVSIGLMRSDGSVHADTAAVVLSSFDVAGVEFRRVHPLADYPSEAIHDNLHH